MKELKFRAWNGRRMLCDDEIGFVPAIISNHAVTLKEAFKALEKGMSGMQYTGVKDRMGKDIYEGDIVKWVHDTGMQNGTKEGGTFVVEWVGFPFFYEFEGVTHPSQCEVVGNIYENME